MAPSSSELISAVNHPLRRRILNAYVAGDVERASTAELAEALDRRMGQVAYHLKMLARSELLKKADYAWVLAVEAEWLRLLLAVWAEAELSG